jgi:2-C-methyl-D-erythritol 4-phosphate cytidylyltransferase
MGGPDKTFMHLMGRPVLFYSVQTLQNCELIDDIVLVLSTSNSDVGRSLVKTTGWDKVVDVCIGGNRRQDSVHRGLKALPDSEWVIVHDAARPTINQKLVTTGLAAARTTGASVAAVPITDTIKTVSDKLIVNKTVPRDSLWAAQTPQIFRRALLIDAHQRVSKTVTDDASMVEQIGGNVQIFHGSERNIKITTQDDLAIAEAVLKSQA